MDLDKIAKILIPLLLALYTGGVQMRQQTQDHYGKKLWHRVHRIEDRIDNCTR